METVWIKSTLITRWRGLADTMPRIRGSECNDVLVCLSMDMYLQSDHVISHLIGHVM